MALAYGWGQLPTMCQGMAKSSRQLPVDANMVARVITTRPHHLHWGPN